MDLRMLVPIFGILLVMIPVAGVTFGLTLRLAVKPFVETLAKALRESGSGVDAHQLTEQVSMLQEELGTLAHEIRELKSAQDFDRQLMASPAESAPTEG
jgi:hypothetical protein